LHYFLSLSLPGASFFSLAPLVSVSLGEALGTIFGFALFSGSLALSLLRAALLKYLFAASPAPMEIVWQYVCFFSNDGCPFSLSLSLASSFPDRSLARFCRRLLPATTQPAHVKWSHATKQAGGINKHHVLPVVTIRNPWRWMQSMCKNPYAARWAHRTSCPHLRSNVGNNEVDGGNTGRKNHDSSTNGTWNAVTVQYGAAPETYQSLIHLWNDWYGEYWNASITNGNRSHNNEGGHSNGNNNNDSNGNTNNDSNSNEQQQEKYYPWIMIRMEDLVFYPVETVTAVCECAGGELYRDQPFQYIVESAKKDSPGHDTSTGIAEAWIRYAKPLQPGAGFTRDDYRATLEAVDATLMDAFGYQNPPGPPPPNDE
jgi:hypothetical protein